MTVLLKENLKVIYITIAAKDWKDASGAQQSQGGEGGPLS